MSSQATVSTAGTASAPIQEVVVPAQQMKSVTRRNGTKLVLYKQPKIKSIYWDFIQLAAKKVDGRKPSNYTSAHAECAWCLNCWCEVDFVKGSSAGVLSHLRDKHQEHLKKKADADDGSDQAKSSLGSVRSVQRSLCDIYASMPKSDMSKASPADQKRGEGLLLYWITTSLRPFKIVEDAGFIMLCEFLNGLNTKFEITERTRLSKQMTKLNKAVSINVKYKMKAEMDWFCVTTDIWTSRTMESFMAVTIHYLDADFRMKEFVLEVRQFGKSHTADHIR